MNKSHEFLGIQIANLSIENAVLKEQSLQKDQVIQQLQSEIEELKENSEVNHDFNS